MKKRCSVFPWLLATVPTSPGSDIFGTTYPHKKYPDSLARVRVVVYSHTTMKEQIALEGIQL